MRHQFDLRHMFANLHNLWAELSGGKDNALYAAKQTSLGSLFANMRFGRAFASSSEALPGLASLLVPSFRDAAHAIYKI